MFQQSYGRNRRSGGFRPRQQFQNKRGGGNPARYVNAAMPAVEQAEYVVQHQFSEFGFEQKLMDNVATRGYETPTPIQDQAIPHLMEGKDVVGLANTGTGKTAAFLLPLINKVLKDSNQGVLIVAPTRELAVQILDEYRAFAAGLPISAALCIGGTSLHTQMQKLRENPHFVIGTPGRLKDLINRRALDLHMFTNIVLDEVDRMLDIGFREDIKFLIARLPKERQSAFFSATINRDAEAIMQSLLIDPVTISVVQRATAHHIEQDVIEVKPGQNKVSILQELLGTEEFKKVIVFGRTKHGINKLEKQLMDLGIRVRAIHGNKSQNARQYALNDFKRGKAQVLLATDIASRGIDVEDVTHVINYDEPQSYDDYVHRIGRTGRAGKAGKALTFISR